MTSALGLAHAIRREVGGKSYVTAPYQWGTVSAVHTSPDTVDLFLDGSSVLTPSIRYLDSYVPTVGDVVLVGRYKADRVVFGTLANGATPITTLQSDVAVNTGDIATNTGSITALQSQVDGTGWVNVPIGSGYTTGTGSNLAQMKAVNHELFFRGLIQPTSGNFATSANITISPAGSLSGAFLVSNKYNMILAGPNFTESQRGILNTDGSISLATSATTGNYVDIAGFTGSRTD